MTPEQVPVEEFDIKKINPLPIVKEEKTVSNRDIANRILHVLSIYPILSPSMLQIGIGTAFPKAAWKPVYSLLLRSGEIKEDIIVKITPNDREQSYRLISLRDTVINHESLSSFHDEIHVDNPDPDAPTTDAGHGIGANDE